MIRANSPKAIQKLRKFILEHTHLDKTELYNPNDFRDYALAINRTFEEEVKFNPFNPYSLKNGSYSDAFIEWLGKKPKILNYSESPIEILGNILEATDEEMKTWNKDKMDFMLKLIIYLTLQNVIDLGY